MRRFFVLAGVLTLIAASLVLATNTAPKRTSDIAIDDPLALPEITSVPDPDPDPARPLERVVLAAATKPSTKAKPKPVPKNELAIIAGVVMKQVADVAVYPWVMCWNGHKVPDHPHIQDCPSRPKVPVIPSVWYRLVRCEANGDWRYGGPGGHTDPGYGEFEGGPNFLHSTWVNYGGRRFAEHAWGATPYEQVEIARHVLASEGVHAWPVCGPRAGLQRGD